MRLVGVNSKVVETIQKIWYLVSSNLISLLLSVVITMVVPKALGVEEYGYWQLYVLYASYVGLFHFGLIDGIVLRYGGMYYEDLDKPLLHSQFVTVAIMQVFIGASICIASLFVGDYFGNIFIMLGVGVSCLIINPRTMLIFVLQITGRVKECARNTVVERLVYAGLILSMILIFNVRQYQFLIMADLVAKICGCFWVAYVCRDIVLSKGISIRASIAEAKTNIAIGLNFLFANLAAQFTIGIIRFTIERKWDITAFGKVSLALSISNLLMIFIGAIGVVMFPIIKRMNPENLGMNYAKLRFMLTAPMLGLMIVCYPARLFLTLWLPKYTESAIYLILLFPLCLFEGRISVLTTNYLKALRLEKLMLYISLTSLFVSVALSWLFAYILQNLTLCILSIILVSAFRCVLSEIIISNKVEIRIYHDLFEELLLVGIFIITGWFIEGLVALLIYAVCYGIYLLLHRDQIRETVHVFFAH